MALTPTATVPILGPLNSPYSPTIRRGKLRAATLVQSLQKKGLLGKKKYISWENEVIALSTCQLLCCSEAADPETTLWHRECRDRPQPRSCKLLPRMLSDSLHESACVNGDGAPPKRRACCERTTHAHVCFTARLLPLHTTSASSCPAGTLLACQRCGAASLRAEKQKSQLQVRTLAPPPRRSVRLAPQQVSS